MGPLLGPQFSPSRDWEMVGFLKPRREPVTDKGELWESRQIAERYYGDLQCTQGDSWPHQGSVYDTHVRGKDEHLLPRVTLVV